MEHVVHGLALRIRGDLPVGRRRSGDGARDTDAPLGPLTVHVQAAPHWAHEPLGIGRTLHRARPDNPQATVIEAGWVVNGSGVRIRYAEGVTFWIGARFDEIWLTYDPPLTSADAAYFLVEPVLAFVLRRLGVLAFHASAVEIGGRAVLFVGAAGAGKSTAAAACMRGGASLLSDDVVALTERGTDWMAQPGTRAIRLWDDGAHALFGDADAIPRFSATWDKRVVEADRIGARTSDRAAPVELICAMAGRERGSDSPRIEPLVGHAALRALLPNTAANYLHETDLQVAELGQLGRLLAHVPMGRLITNDNVATIPDIANVIRRHVGA